MPTIQLIDYEASARCRTVNLTCLDSFPPKNCTFEGGNIYGLCGDIREGSWALSWALGGRSEQSSGEILLDGVHALQKDLKGRSCFIGEPYCPSINSPFLPGSVRACLTKALQTGPTGWTLEALTEAFNLTPERFDRSPMHVQHPQSWYLSAAIGFAAGKDVFCFPYLTAQTLRTVENMYAVGVLNLLSEYNKIILLPSVHSDRLSAICDRMIDTFIPASTIRCGFSSPISRFKEI
ncbi:MAG: hypothetical protein IJE08_15220 [Clostridia bacterium]|nr:hypothetical protein [Clostridia bacterium]